MDMGLVKGWITVVTLLTFLGICWWAYRPANRRRFEDDGWLAFADDEAEALRRTQRSGDGSDAGRKIS